MNIIHQWLGLSEGETRMRKYSLKTNQAFNGKITLVFFCFSLCVFASGTTWAAKPNRLTPSREGHGQELGLRLGQSPRERQRAHQIGLELGTLTPPLEEGRKELGALIRRARTELQAETGLGRAPRGAPQRLGGRMVAERARVLDVYERAILTGRYSQARAAQVYADYCSSVQENRGGQDRLSQVAQEFAQSVRGRGSPEERSSPGRLGSNTVRSELRMAESFALLARVYSDELLEKIPSLHPLAEEMANAAANYASIIKRGDSSSNRKKVREAKRRLNQTHQKLLQKWRQCVEAGDGDSNCVDPKHLEDIDSEPNFRSAGHFSPTRPRDLSDSPRLGELRRELPHDSQVDQRTGCSSSPSRIQVRGCSDTLELARKISRLEADPDEPEVDDLDSQLGDSAKRGLKSQVDRGRGDDKVEAHIISVISNLKAKGKDAYKNAGGATGAKLLKDESGQYRFVAKSLTAPSLGIAHYTLQRYLPELFDRFEYSPTNEITVPALAEILNVSPDLIPRSRVKELPLGEKGAEESFVLIDFKGGKMDFAKKGSSGSAEFQESLARLADQSVRKEVTEAALFTLLIGNVDLHEENIMINQDKKGDLGLTLIDFGLTMPVANPTQGQKHKKPVFSYLGDLELDRNAALKFLDRLQDKEVQRQLFSKIEGDYDSKHKARIKQAFTERVDFLLNERRRMRDYGSTPTFQAMFRPLDPDSYYMFR